MEQRAMSYHSQGLARALATLKALAGDAEKGLGLAELARRLDLPKSTLIRLLMVMEDEGFVQRDGDPPVYSIGPSVLDIASAYRPADVAAVAAPAMRQLAQTLGFTTNLGTLEGRSVLHLHVEEPTRALRFAASGTLDFTYCTGLGKMLLSTLDDGRLGEHIPEREPFTEFTQHTIRTRAQLESELDEIRERGYSLDDEERNRGVTCLAVLVPAAVPMSLSVSAPAGELASDGDREACLREVRAAAAGLAADPRFVRSLAVLAARGAVG